MEDRPVLQFNLRRLFLLTTVVAVLCALLRKAPAEVVVIAAIVFFPAYVPLIFAILFRDSRAFRLEFLTFSVFGVLPMMCGTGILAFSAFDIIGQSPGRHLTSIATWASSGALVGTSVVGFELAMTATSVWCAFAGSRRPRLNWMIFFLLSWLILSIAVLLVMIALFVR